MNFKERLSTVIWWLGIVVAVGFCLLAVLAGVDVIGRFADGGDYQTRRGFENLGICIALLLGMLASYLIASTIRYLLIGVFWARPKITGPKGGELKAIIKD